MGPTGCGYGLSVEFDKPLSVRLVRECELVHAGLTQMLSGYADRVRVLPLCPDSGEVADIALVDPFRRPATDEPGAPAQVTRPAGTPKVAVYTWEHRDGYVERAMLGGADGYLSKELPSHELVAALEKVHAGERIVALDLDERSEPSPSPALALTPRELHVVSLIAAGAANKEIARRLGLTMNTVKSHVRGAYRAMGVTSRSQAVLWAVEHGVSAPWVAVRDEA